MGRTARALGSVALLVALTGGPAGASHVQVPHARFSSDAASIRTPSRSARCAPAPRRSHVRPPAAIVFTTRCGRYELATDGSVIRLGPRPPVDRRIEIVWP